MSTFSFCHESYFIYVYNSICKSIKHLPCSISGFCVHTQSAWCYFPLLISQLLSWYCIVSWFFQTVNLHRTILITGLDPLFGEIEQNFDIQTFVDPHSSVSKFQKEIYDACIYLALEIIVPKIDKFKVKNIRFRKSQIQLIQHF